jgi:lipopolysaccharide/colanic/teichoic acid biosynthesis glycosyltransferase
LEVNVSGLSDLVKRAIDVVGAASTLLVAFPLLVALSWRIRRELGSPVLFTQERPGRGGRPFRLVKFRSMTDARGPDGTLLPDAERLTLFGRWLRATSLDELPEVWNVLRGEMSLVGPRPLLLRYVERYTPEQARRHEVRPGITGWAQVNGRNAIDWETKLALDVWYVDHRSIWLDLKIVAMTFVQVIRRDGITAANEATMPEFRGTVTRTAHDVTSTHRTAR